MKMKNIYLKFFYLLLGLAVAVACAKDEEVFTGNIMGKVTDAVTGEVLQGVTVSLSPGGVSKTTGSDGTFEFLELSPKQYEIQARKAEYLTNHKTVNVVAGRDVASDIQLTPEEKDSKLVLSVSSLNFGESNSSLSFDIINEGKSRFNWNISGLDKIDWLEVNPASGTLDAGKSNAVQVNLLRENITEYKEATITVNADNESVALKITVEPKNENARIALSTNTLDFGTEYTSLTFDVMNVGDAGDVEWNITGIDVDWIVVTPLADTIGVGKSSVVKVEINREVLPEGNQSTTILVNGDGESHRVTVNVVGEKRTPKITISPSTLEFGLELSTLTFDIANVGDAGDIDWEITHENADWLSVAPLTGTTAMEESSTVEVSVNREKMAEGKQTATIQVKAYGESFPVTIHAEKKPARYIEVNPETIVLGTNESASLSLISHNGETAYELIVEGESAWASPSKNGGVIPEYNAADENTVEVVTITADRTGLAIGEYSCTLIIRSDLGDIRVPVSMTVEKPKVGIYSLEDLMAFRNARNVRGDVSKWKDENGVITLYTDIDLGEMEWVPIKELFVNETFDGNGHAIKMKKTTFEPNEMWGFFIRNSGEIKDINIEVCLQWDDLFINDEGENMIAYKVQHVGILCYSNYGKIVDSNILLCENSVLSPGETFGGIANSNSGIIESCSVEGEIKLYGGGGICAQNSGVIRGCINRLQMYNYENHKLHRVIGVGGIAAHNGGSGKIYNCINEATLNFPHTNLNSNFGNSIGGLIGSMTSGRIENSVNKGDINCSNECRSVGGILGRVYESPYDKSGAEGERAIMNCANQGNVLGEVGTTGGIIGSLQIKDLVMEGCTYGGTVNGVPGSEENAIGHDMRNE